MSITEGIVTEAKSCVRCSGQHTFLRWILLRIQPLLGISAKGSLGVRATAPRLPVRVQLISLHPVDALALVYVAEGGMRGTRLGAVQPRCLHS